MAAFPSSTTAGFLHACEPRSGCLLDSSVDMTSPVFHEWHSFMHDDFHVEDFWYSLEADMSVRSGAQGQQWDISGHSGEGGREYHHDFLIEREWSNMFDGDYMQQQIDEFFRLGTGATDARVEELADGSCEVPSGAKQIGRPEKTMRKYKEHHEYVVKRSLQRARRRAAQQGSTLYRGRRLTCHELGQPGTPCLDHQLRIGHRDGMQHRDAGRLDQLLQAWPPRQGPMTQEQAMPLRSGQLGVVSVNLGGFSKEGYDEFQQWAHTENVKLHVHIIFLQETWRPSSEFSSDAWHWVQSGTQKSKNQGVAVLVNRSLASAACLRVAEVVKGRLLKLRIPADMGHPLRRRPITLVCVYQHARVSEQAVVYEKRERLWEQINHVLATIPRRHLLVAAGDWNTPLQEDAPCVGAGVLQSKWLPSDHAQFAALIRNHNLCAMNTWRAVRHAATFVGPPESGSSSPQVQTQIDFILGRQGQVGKTGRAAAPVHHVHFSSWRHGARHVPVAAILSDTRAEWKPSREQKVVGPSRDCMVQELTGSSEVQAAFQHRVDVLISPLEVGKGFAQNVDAALLEVASDMFPAHQARSTKPWQTSEVQLSLKTVWHERDQLLLAGRKVLAAEHVAGLMVVWRQWVLFQKARKMLRKQSTASRRQRWDKALTEAEEALAQGNSHQFYATVKQMAPRGERGRVQLRTKDGDILTAEEELEVMHHYWQKVFDSRSLDVCAWQLQEGLDIQLGEVQVAIQALAVRKATMPGTAPSAAWKYGGDLLARKIHKMLQSAWGPGALVHDDFLTQSWLHFLSKPGRTLREPGDLRPIALQPGASKILSSILKRRLQPYVENIARNSPQFAYVAGRGTAEAISQAAGHCERVRAAVRAQKMDLRSKYKGVQQVPCAGGCQLSIDMSRAFDSVPRDLLRDALQWAGVPDDLLVLLLSWHEQSTYVLGSRHDDKLRRSIDVTRGVKQGCIIAPSLWVIYSCFVWYQIDCALGHTWTDEHITGFADDFHFRWELGSYRQCRQVGLDIDTIFRVLKLHGLQINPSKSSFLVEVRGSDAEKWLRKHRFRNKADDGWCFRFNLFTREEVPIVKSFKYLGVILSYHCFEDETLRYRMEMAQSHRNRLAKVLQGRGGLGLSQRKRIWLVCVQTSQLYGLCVTGITPAGLKRLHIQMMKHVRAFAKSPRHLTQESDSELLRRLGVVGPLEVLIKQVSGMLERQAVETRLPSFGQDSLLGRLRRLQTDLLSLRPEEKPAAPETAACSLQEMPQDTPQFACQVCGQVFPTLHQVKTHEGRFHKRFAPKRELGNKADYSLDGLPTCKFCRKEFSKWHPLQRHIRENRCPGLRDEEALAQARSKPDPKTAEAGDTGEVGMPASGPVAWKKDALVSQSILRPVAQWDSVLALPQPRRWEVIVKLPGVVERLRHRCVLCDQWIAKANGVRKHLQIVHASEWQAHVQIIQHWARSWSGVIRSPCPVCGVKVVDARQHAGSCVVMFQAALLQLISSGGRDADEHSLQVDARGERSGDGGCRGAPDPNCLQEAEAGSAQQPRIGQGPGQGQGQKQGATAWVTGAKQPADLGLRRYFGAARSCEKTGPPGPQECRDHQQNRIRHMFSSAAQHQAPSRHGHTQYVQSCARVAQDARGQSSGIATVPEAGHAPVSSERGSGSCQPDVADTGRQKGGGKAGLPRGGVLGVSDLGSRKADQRQGHDSCAPASGRLHHSSGEAAEVCHGDGSDKISGTQAVDTGPRGSTDPFLAGCVTQGLLPPRFITCVDTAQCVQPGGRTHAEIEDPAGSAAGADVPDATPSLTWLNSAVLGNAANHCYANTVLLALAASEVEVSGSGPVHSLIRKIRGHGDRIFHLCKQGEWRLLTVGWRDPQRQHDTAEFLQHLYQADAALGSLSCWQAVQDPDMLMEGLPHADSGGGCVLLPVRSVANRPYITLQECVLAWHEQLHMHIFQMEAHTVVLQLDRFCMRGPFVHKDLTPIAAPEGRLLLPVIDQNGAHVWLPYAVRAIILHIGQSPLSGHYRMAYADAGAMRITDDNKPSAGVSANDRVDERAYMYFLRRV